MIVCCVPRHGEKELVKNGFKDLEEAAPGIILQQMHIKRRIRRLQKKLGRRELRFCDSGAGKGLGSRHLLGLGLSGVGVDLLQTSCARNEENNREAIEAGRYAVFNDSFLDRDFGDDRFDVIFSCMVLAHLAPENVEAYFAKFREHLTDGGVLINLVPAGMQFWGIEDKLVGHFKRYSFECWREIAQRHGLEVRQLHGLTCPLSNMLLPISNAVNTRQDRDKLDLPLQERTELSGNRHVRFKHIYPWYFRIVLNEISLLPFDVLQRMFRNSRSSMVIYSELARPA